MEELQALGCKTLTASCDDAPSWVYSTSYWTGSARTSNKVWNVFSSNYFTNNEYIYDYGVRPVITISKDQISGIKSEVKPVANGSLDEVGTVVTIGSEQFYTIGTEGDNVKLFAKYNLLVGNRYDGTNGTVVLENPTGRQNSKALGYFEGYSVEEPILGNIGFSSTDYWSSTVSSYPAHVYNSSSNLYTYVENYKSYLEGLGVDVNYVSLITIEELEGLGCVRSNYSCSAAPEWIYSTSYWSGSAYSSTGVWGVNSDSVFINSYYASDYNRGVRPVIVISKSEF